MQIFRGQRWVDDKKCSAMMMTRRKIGSSTRYGSLLWATKIQWPTIANIGYPYVCSEMLSAGGNREVRVSVPLERPDLDHL